MTCGTKEANICKRELDLQNEEDVQADPLSKAA